MDKIAAWIQQGVSFIQPNTVVVDETVIIGEGSIIGAGVHLLQGTIIGKNCTIGSYAILDEAILEENVVIKPYSVIIKSSLGTSSSVGPFAHIYESTLAHHTDIGNFVEVKRTSVGANTKAKHLAYLGDAIIGSYVNIGAGSITCNYNGKEKHTTVIHDNVFIGSNSTLIAPITIHHDAYTAAGSTITQDVPAQSLAIARSRQTNKEGYALRLKKSNLKQNSTEVSSPIPQQQASLQADVL